MLHAGTQSIATFISPQELQLKMIVEREQKISDLETILVTH
jgi:hypothetical protein